MQRADDVLSAPDVAKVFRARRLVCREGIVRQQILGGDLFFMVYMGAACNSCSVENGTYGFRSSATTFWCMRAICLVTCEFKLVACNVRVSVTDPPQRRFGVRARALRSNKG